MFIFFYSLYIYVYVHIYQLKKNYITGKIYNKIYKPTQIKSTKCQYQAIHKKLKCLKYSILINFIRKVFKIKKLVPIKTWALWNLVSLKKILLHILELMEKFASIYSKNWNMAKYALNTYVNSSLTIDPR